MLHWVLWVTFDLLQLFSSGTNGFCWLSVEYELKCTVTNEGIAETPSGPRQVCRWRCQPSIMGLIIDGIWIHVVQVQSDVPMCSKVYSIATSTPSFDSSLLNTSQGSFSSVSTSQESRTSSSMIETSKRHDLEPERTSIGSEPASVDSAVPAASSSSATTFPSADPPIPSTPKTTSVSTIVDSTRRRPAGPSAKAPDLSLKGAFLTDSSVRALPDDCTALDIPHARDITGDCFQDLPRMLQTLILTENTRIKAFDIHHLPRGLTHLDLAHNTTLDDESASCLPKTLTHLNLACNSYITNAGIRHLKKAPLTYLNLASNKKLSSLCFHDLSRSLTHLNLNGMPSIDPFDIASIPRSINRLELGSVSNMSSKDLALLTSHTDKLEYLDIHSNKFKGDAIKFFPRSLTVLLIDASKFKDSDSARAFPSSLNSLHISSSSKITIKFIQLLPPSITDLNIDSAKISGSDVPALGHTFPGLVTLSMASSKLSDGWVKFLPRNLVCLDLRHNEKLTDSSIDSFPPNLSILIIGSPFLTSDCSVLLPKKLVSLTLGTSNLTASCIKGLPRSLTSLSIPNSWLNTSSLHRSAFPPGLVSLTLHPENRQWAKHVGLPIH